MKFVRLTRPDGSAIWFVDGMIVQPPPQTAPERSKTMIIHNGQHFVRESIGEVLAAFGLDEAGRPED
jgi:hypothetical protein